MQTFKVLKANVLSKSHFCKDKLLWVRLFEQKDVCAWLENSIFMNVTLLFFNYKNGAHCLFIVHYEQEARIQLLVVLKFKLLLSILVNFVAMNNLCFGKDVKLLFHDKAVWFIGKLYPFNFLLPHQAHFVVGCNQVVLNNVRLFLFHVLESYEFLFKG